MLSDRVGVVDFPTLGDVVDGWVTQHCRVPDRHARGKPFKKYDWQYWCTANFYRVREDAVHDPDVPLMNQAFVYRRALIVGPQKAGKGPDAAADVAAQAVGPTEFCGWARAGDAYVCADHGCPCGWSWDYEPGEPMGTRNASPLIQLTATSQEQVDNVFRPLVAMIHLGPLGKLLAPRGNFIRVLGTGNDNPDVDRIDAVTSSALSRLGNPISYAHQDETGVYTTTNGMRNVAETQRRGAAGMGGRSMEHTNPWDPGQNSVAQTTFESQAADVFKFYRQPPANWSFGDKRERRKILAFAYAGSDHINLDSIEAEAAELMVTDPAQAERFFGNRLVQGHGAWLPDGLWDKAAV